VITKIGNRKIKQLAKKTTLRPVLSAQQLRTKFVKEWLTRQHAIPPRHPFKNLDLGNPWVTRRPFQTKKKGQAERLTLTTVLISQKFWVGAGEGNRTLDTQLGKLMFYH
jgi:hypothetical protein